MLKTFLKQSFYTLPTQTQYSLYKLLRPKNFKNLQKQRKIQTNSNYSLKPFDDHKCIFVHIPKCAGVSICKTLFGNLAGGHTSINKYQLIFGPDDFSNYFKFTIVRNPWDRLVSAFHFMKSGGMVESDKVWALKYLSPYNNFNDFVVRWINKKNVRTTLHFVPQVEFLYSLKKRDKFLVDFVGYFENLEKDFNYVCNKLRVKKKLLKINPSKKKDYKMYYTEETKKIVADIYRDDIEVLGYNFDNSTIINRLIYSENNLS